MAPKKPELFFLLKGMTVDEFKQSLSENETQITDHNTETQEVVVGN